MCIRDRYLYGHVSLYFLFQLQVCIIDLKVTVEGPGVPILSRLSESPSCWHLRVTVTLTPEDLLLVAQATVTIMIGESNYSDCAMIL